MWQKPPKKRENPKTWWAKNQPKTPQEPLKRRNLVEKIGFKNPPKIDEKLITWWVFEMKTAPQE
ncbi:MAG: hypothetical protein GXY87_01075 [Tissierellia bacterium]|nr:hypothetical protein [Tissierellia bacterium]